MPPTPTQQQQQQQQARRQGQAKEGGISSSLQRSSQDADLAKYNAQKALLEATLTNLRTKLTEVEGDNWLFEAPRYSYH